MFSSSCVYVTTCLASCRRCDIPRGRYTLHVFYYMLYILDLDRRQCPDAIQKRDVSRGPQSAVTSPCLYRDVTADVTDVRQSCDRAGRSAERRRYYDTRVQETFSRVPAGPQPPLSGSSQPRRRAPQNTELLSSTAHRTRVDRSLNERRTNTERPPEKAPCLPGTPLGRDSACMRSSTTRTCGRRCWLSSSARCSWCLWAVWPALGGRTRATSRPWCRSPSALASPWRRWRRSVSTGAGGALEELGCRKGGRLVRGRDMSLQMWKDWRGWEPLLHKQVNPRPTGPPDFPPPTGRSVFDPCLSWLLLVVEKNKKWFKSS